MKHYVFGILFILLATPLLCIGQQKKPIISFDNKVCDFGTVKYKQNTVLKIKFYYKNTGDAPLVIYKVDTSCGCTVPNWTKMPIPVGKRDYISVVLKTKGKAGQIQKSLFVKTNTDNKVTVLHIKGEIS